MGDLRIPPVHPGDQPVHLEKGSNQAAALHHHQVALLPARDGPLRHREVCGEGAPEQQEGEDGVEEEGGGGLGQEC